MCALYFFFSVVTVYLWCVCVCVCCEARGGDRVMFHVRNRRPNVGIRFVGPLRPVSVVLLARLGLFFFSMLPDARIQGVCRRYPPASRQCRPAGLVVIRIRSSGPDAYVYDRDFGRNGRPLPVPFDRDLRTTTTESSSSLWVCSFDRTEKLDRTAPPPPADSSSRARARDSASSGPRDGHCIAQRVCAR